MACHVKIVSSSVTWLNKNLCEMMRKRDIPSRFLVVVYETLNDKSVEDFEHMVIEMYA